MINIRTMINIRSYAESQFPPTLGHDLLIRTARRCKFPRLAVENPEAVKDCLENALLVL